jgi:outer membrane receptor protein involved in Fe transport
MPVGCCRHGNTGGIALNGLRSRRPVVVTLAASACLLFAGSSLAQIDEIIVTARKKEENLQDIPVSVTAFTRDSIERRGIRRIGDIAKLTPSLQFDESFAQSDTRIVIRGLSPTRGRQNVAVLVDGIDLSSEAITSSGGSLLINQRLLDVERIEVVKGPQIALFGRAAFNGALQYVTKRPSDEFEADVRVEANGENQYNADASVSFPVLGEALGLRINGSVWDEQGFYDNELTGNSVGDQEGWGLALSTRSAFENGLVFNLRAEYTADEGRPSAQTFVPFNTVLDVPESAQDGPGAANLAQCYENFIAAIGDPAQAAGPGEANDQRLVERARRIVDPAVAAQLNFPDPATATGADYRAVVLANPFLSPHCEDQVLAYTGALPDGEEIALRQATDPRNPGQDYRGFDRDLWRLALTGEWALDRGAFNFWAGYLRDENTETQDSNTFGVPSNNIYRDANVNAFSFLNDKTTEQINFELRYATDFEGPVNVSLGLQVWEENVDNGSRSITTQVSGSHCFWNSDVNFIVPVNDVACPGYTETLSAPYLEAAAPFRPASPVDRDTSHQSIYGQVEWALNDSVNLTFEGRYSIEETTVFGPVFYDPTASGGPGGLNPCGIFFRPCEPFDENFEFADAFDPNDPDLTPEERLELLGNIPQVCIEQDPAAVQRSIDLGPADGVDYFNPWCVDSLQNKESWFIPKVTLDWKASEDSLLYFKWSRSQKPGGFSLLTVGSAGLDRDLSEFKPEKMTVWEVGGKSEWLQRTLRLNGAIFFQDYTDKQALTSDLGSDGRLISRIENAGAAEVWGAEVDITWQPESEFIGGAWSFNAGYTWLNTEYTDFKVRTASAVRAAGAGNCRPVSSIPGGPRDLCEIDYTGNKLEDAADGAFAGSIRYDRQLTASLGLYFETDIQWTDDRFTDIENAAFVKAFWNTDFRVGLQGENWEVLAYVNNVFEDDTVRFTGGGPGLGCCFVLGSGIDIGSNAPSPAPEDIVMVDLPLYTSAFLPPPRVIGMRASYRFGGPK